MHDESDGLMSKGTKENVAKEKVTKEKMTKGKVTKEKVAEAKVTREKVKKERVKKETAMEMTAARNQMRILLEQMRQKGVKLFVDGEAALPGEIASKAVCEGSVYMADYVLGDSGAIEQVRFDKVTGR